MALRRLTRHLPPARLFWREMRHCLQFRPLLFGLAALLALGLLTDTLHGVLQPLWAYSLTGSLFPESTFVRTIRDVASASFPKVAICELLRVALTLFNPLIVGYILLCQLALRWRLASARGQQLQVTPLSSPQLFLAIAIPAWMLCLALPFLYLLVMDSFYAWGIQGLLLKTYGYAHDWTFGEYFAENLSRSFVRMLYLPKGAFMIFPLTAIMLSMLRKREWLISGTLHVTLPTNLIMFSIWHLQIHIPLAMHESAFWDDRPWLIRSPYWCYSTWGFGLSLFAGIALSLLAAPRFRRLLEEE